MMIKLADNDGIRELEMEVIGSCIWLSVKIEGTDGPMEIEVDADQMMRALVALIPETRSK